MRYYLPDRTARELVQLARKHDIAELILFGSRAKGTHTERSDIDIAARGGDFDGFYWDLKENLHSLLMVDLVNLEESVSQELLEEIRQDGVSLYEKT